VFPAKHPGRCCALQRTPFLEHLLRGGFLVPSPRALRGLVLLRPFFIFLSSFTKI